MVDNAISKGRSTSSFMVDNTISKRDVLHRPLSISRYQHVPHFIADEHARRIETQVKCLIADQHTHRSKYKVSLLLCHHTDSCNLPHVESASAMAYHSCNPTALAFIIVVLALQYLVSLSIALHAHHMFIVCASPRWHPHCIGQFYNVLHHIVSVFVGPFSGGCVLRFRMFFFAL